MKNIWILLFSVICMVSCNREGLTEEQRKQLKQEKQNREIKRVSEAEILSAAKKMAEKQLKQSDDSLSHIRKVLLTDTVTIEYDRVLQSAYLYALENQLPISDNVEELKGGTLIYSEPIREDGKVLGFWIVELDKREVIKSIE